MTEIIELKNKPATHTVKTWAINAVISALLLLVSILPTPSWGFIILFSITLTIALIILAGYLFLNSNSNAGISIKTENGTPVSIINGRSQETKLEDITEIYEYYEWGTNKSCCLSFYAKNQSSPVARLFLKNEQGKFLRKKDEQTLLEEAIKKTSTVDQLDAVPEGTHNKETKTSFNLSISKPGALIILNQYMPID